jgi:hypothetical protein
MAISITSRNYATRNHSAGNTFLLQNGGQIVTETIDFVIDFDYLSTQNEQIQFITDYTIQVLGSDWNSKGFVIGDSVSLIGALGSTPVALTTTITDIDGDLMTFADDVPGATGQVMPLSAGADSNTQLRITNNTRSIPESVEVYHNIVSNASSGTINSFVDGEVNRFEANGVNAMAVNDVLPLVQLGNKSGGSYYSATLKRIADVSSNKAGRITLEYKLPTEFEDSDFDFPSYLSGSQSLKPYIVINCYPQENNPNSQLTISYGSQNGNVGWYNESHNQGVNDFTVESVLITDIDDNPLSSFDYTKVNKVTAVISGSTNFVKKAELNFYTIPEQIDVKNQLASRKDLIYDSNSFIDDTTITNKVSGLLGRNVAITNQVLTLGTNQITIAFRLAPNTAFTEYFEALPSEQRRIRLTASVESDGGDANNNNNVSLILEQGLSEKAPIFGGTYEDVTSAELYDHVDNELLPSDEPCGCDTILVTYTLVGEEPVTVEVESTSTEYGKNFYDLGTIGGQTYQIGWDGGEGDLWIVVENGGAPFQASLSEDTECPFGTFTIEDGSIFEAFEVTSVCSDYGVICTEDDFLYNSIFKLPKYEAWKSLKCAVIIEKDSDNQTFELTSETLNFGAFPVTTDGKIQINYTKNLAQFLDNPNNRNVFKVVLTSPTTTDKYSVQIYWSLMANWRYWLPNTNALIDFFDSSLPNNGLNAEWMRYVRGLGYSIKVRSYLTSPDDVEYTWDTDFAMQDYDEEPNITSVITLKDDTDTVQSVLLDNQIMTIVATHTLTSGDWAQEATWGWISIRPKEAEPNKRISTEFTGTAQDLPLKETVTLDFPSPNVAVVTCKVDTSLIISENSTIICRIEQNDDYKLIEKQVHKQEFKKVKLPFEAIHEDRGISACATPQLVLADLTDANYHKNDRTALAFKFDSMTIELESDTETILAPGISVTFPNQSDAVGYVVDWRQVTADGQLKQGCWKIKVNWEIDSLSGWFYYGSYQLREYSVRNARDTVQMFIVLNDLVRKQGINYKDSGFAGTIRFKGYFGFMQPNYDSLNIIYTDRVRNKVRNEALRSYELRTDYLLSCMTRLIDEECLLTANQIYITDNTATNHVQYYQFAVILNDKESPKFEYPEGSLFAKMTVSFLDKVAVHESKYDGNIQGSENVILSLPNTTTTPVTTALNVSNSNDTYDVDITTNLTLPDTTLQIYVDGELEETITFVTLDPDAEITIEP